MKEENDKVFWFLAGLASSAILYVFLITFLPIPEANIRHADTALGFMLGTLVTSIVGYYIGASPILKTKQPEGTTTAEINATITTTENETNKE